MLKLKPRSITVALLLLFLGFFGLQHAVYSLSFGTDKATAKSARLLLSDTLPIISWIERQDFDLHLRSQRDLPINQAVTVVEINERSIRELGQFPFPRKIYREFLQKLEAAGAKVVAFDVTYPEREANEALAELRQVAGEIAKTEGSGSRTATLLEERVGKLDGDKAFAQGLREAKMPVVLGFAISGSTQGAKPVSEHTRQLLLRHDIFRRQVQDDAFARDATDLPILPHDELLEALPAHSSVGSFTADPDNDSVIRRALGVMSFYNMALGTLAVRAVAAYLGVELALNGEDGLRIEDKDQKGLLSVPLNPQGSFLLRYYGPGGTFPYVEFADVISGKADSSKLKGKIIFVGATAVGLRDLRASPFDKDYPGVEVHATFASNMLSQHYLVKDSRFYWAGYGFVVALLLSVSFFVYRLQPLYAFGLTLGLLGGFQLFAQDMFFDRGLVVPTLIPSLGALSALFAGVLYRYFTEEQEKRVVRTAFSRYVSGAVVGEILKDPSKLKLGGQKKELTVMFCDLMGFTKLSEHMDAGQLTQLLNEYFTRMTRIILRNHGTLDKYMGDAIMCFWGAPLDLPGHADFACATALEMVEELHKINAEWKEKYGLTIGLRIGLNTGEMAVGNMGSEQVFSYTVMGDNVNLGSRLEGVNNVYATTVIVSDATRMSAGQAFRYRALDKVQVKGKEDAVEIFELLGLAAGPDPEWLHAFHAGLAAYREGRWDEAEAAFGTCLALKPSDAPTEVFLERVRNFKVQRPENWDGVWKLASK